MKDKPCLWSGYLKAGKDEKQAALNDLETTLLVPSADILALWKSLRASMMRKVKRSRMQDNYQSGWKFYQAMLFLKPTLFNIIVNTKNNLFQRKVVSVLSVVFIIAKRFRLSACRIVFRLSSTVTRFGFLHFWSRQEKLEHQMRF